MATLDRSIGSNADLGTKDLGGDNPNHFYDLSRFGDCWLGADNSPCLWIRFPNITIPQGATVQVAHVTLDVAYVQDSGQIDAEIFAIDEDDHVAPTDNATWHTDHGLHTSASESWSFTAQGSGTLQTVDISAVIQEILDRGGWQSGNAIGIHIDEVDSVGTQAVDGATLHVEYTEGSSAHELAGSIDASATLAGDAVIRRVLAGSVDASATLNGVLVARRALAGSIDGQAALSGAMLRTRDLAGSIDATAAFAATLRILRPLTGQLTADASLSGSMLRTRNLVGSVDATAALAGDLVIRRVLEGSIDAAADLAGLLTIVGEAHELAGTIAAVATVEGSMLRTRNLAGQIAATATLDGELVIRRVLAGTIAAAASLEGEMQRRVFLVGVIEGVAAVSGHMQRRMLMQGAIEAQATLQGNLTIGERTPWWTPSPVGYEKEPVGFSRR